MKPTTFILTALFFMYQVSAFWSDTDTDGGIRLGPTEDFKTDNEMKKFNQKLDSVAEKVEEIVKVEVAELLKRRAEEAKSPNKVVNDKKEEVSLDFLIDRIRRKAFAKVTRDYNLFTTLDDGTFYGDMFNPPEGYYKNDEPEQEI